MKTKLTALFDELSKLIAKIYNPLDKRIKIGLMVFVSAVFAGLTLTLIGDIQALQNLNKYLQVITNALLPFLTIVYNILQETARQKGTELLAAEGDEQTIQQLYDKIQTTKDIIAK